MTDDELRAIEIRHKAATPGEWMAGIVLYADQGNGRSTTLGECLKHRNDSEFATRAHQDIPKLIAEVRRLKRGEFTPEEFQNLCHHRDERPGCTFAEFKAGCETYWSQLFGPEAVVTTETR